MSRQILDSETQNHHDKLSLRFWMVASLILVGTTILFSPQRNSIRSVGLDLQLPSAPTNLPTLICVDLPSGTSSFNSYRLAAAAAIHANESEKRQFLSGRLDQDIFEDEIPPEPDGTQCFYKDSLDKARRHLLPTD